MLIASETASNVSVSSDFLSATYIHETANIISMQMFGSTTTTPYQAGPIDPNIRIADRDMGAALEECLFGGLMGSNGNIYK